jgi:hypothetical protein
MKPAHFSNDKATITADDILESFRLRPPVHVAYDRACWQCFAPWQIAALFMTRARMGHVSDGEDASMVRLASMISVLGFGVASLFRHIYNGRYSMSLAAWGIVSCAIGLWLIIRSFRYRASWPCFLALGSWGPFCYAVFGSLPVFLIVTGFGHFTWQMIWVMAAMMTLNVITGFKVMDNIAKDRYKLLMKEAYAYEQAKKPLNVSGLTITNNIHTMQHKR